MQALKNNRAPGDDERLVCGLFSKKEAAVRIAGGTQHLHSSTLGSRDACARETRSALESRGIPQYSWEKAADAKALSIVSSAQRYEQIRELSGDPRVGTRRDLKEKLESVLEELISNAIYHAYRKPDGSTRYARRDAIQLTELEKIAIQFHPSADGIYLNVTDQGGSFRFRDVSESFGRCYGEVKDQIAAKEQGAGLGIYMSFEVVTHLKIVTRIGRETSVSCWIADKASFDPDTFSFNYFERR